MKRGGKLLIILVVYAALILLLCYELLQVRIGYQNSFDKAAEIRIYADYKVVIVVLVNNRTEYLKSLIESLSRVRGIENALLVFSHNVDSPELNSLVAKTKNFTAQTVQLFYPFRLQIYTNRYPGQSPTDCHPRNIPKMQARLTGCRNWKYPDKHGNYREATTAQIKLHFWWMLNEVYNRFVSSKDKTNRNFTGYTVLLEEDFFIAPDALYVLERLSNIQPQTCPSCDLLVLGTDTAIVESYTDAQMFAETKTEYWVSGEHFRGMALSAYNFRQLFECAKAFCTFDDYNYDFSVMYANLHCFMNPWRILRPSVPRVFHVGTCGFHRRTKHCHAKVETLQAYMEEYKPHLFPTNIKSNSREMEQWGNELPEPVGYGGWGDPRDHSLCLSMVQQQ